LLNKSRSDEVHRRLQPTQKASAVEKRYGVQVSDTTGDAKNYKSLFQTPSRRKIK
jgi:hypothetical protein